MINRTYLNFLVPSALKILFSWSLCFPLISLGDELESYIKKLKSYDASVPLKTRRDTISSILSLDKDNVLALNYLAVLHSRSKKYGLARLVLDRALVKAPNNHVLLNNLAVLDLHQGDEKASLNGFSASLKSNKNYLASMSNLGSLYLKYGDYKRALSPLEQAYQNVKLGLKSRNQNSVEIANNYAVVLSEIGQAKEARLVYEEIFKGGAQDENILLNYATLLIDVLKDRKQGLRAASKLKFLTENRKILSELEKLERRLDKLE